MKWLLDGVLRARHNASLAWVCSRRTAAGSGHLSVPQSRWIPHDPHGTSVWGHPLAASGEFRELFCDSLDEAVVPSEPVRAPLGDFLVCGSTTALQAW